MADIAFSEQIRDTNTYTEHLRCGVAGTVYQIDNDLDAEATVTLYGTHVDDTSNFNDRVQVGSATVSADSTDSIAVSDPWEVIQVEAVATSGPSTDTLTVYQHES